MAITPPQSVLKVFSPIDYKNDQNESGEISLNMVGGGLINHTFKITYGKIKNILLQQINKNVFNSPEDVQENYINIWKYLELKSGGLKIPSPIFIGESPLFIDENKEYWRAFEYIEEIQVFPIAQNAKQAELTAVAFANLTSLLNDFDARLLKNIIPGFHDLSLRYKQFEESLNNKSAERINTSGVLIKEAKKRNFYILLFEKIRQSDQFPLRVMHHDAKIANILFNKNIGAVICPVDFDTTMPGYFFSDAGDMIRSMACTEDENSTNFNGIQIRKDFYEAITNAYQAIMGNKLTESEKTHFHYSGLLIIYMQALRFLTDYLNGDIYYQVNYPEQNFDRAKNQFKLLENLESFLKENYNFII